VHEALEASAIAQRKANGNIEVARRLEASDNGSAAALHQLGHMTGQMMARLGLSRR
jgi:hypothetical protein